MRNQKFMKLAGVLLLSAVLLFSATAVTANTNKLTTMTTNAGEYYGGAQTTSRDTVWDNGADDGTGNGLSSQNDLVYPFNSQMADDFQLTTAADITGVGWWGTFWNGAGYPNPTEFNVIFYADDGTGNMPTGAGMPDPTPTALAVYNFPAVTGTSVGTDRYSYEVTLPTAFSAAAGTKYWVCCQWVGGFTQYGQWGWNTNGANTDQLHEAMQGFPLLSKPYWSLPGTAGQYGDMAYYLLGGSGEDTTPPVTTCTLEGTMNGTVYISDVTVALTATDAGSGVNYTRYKLDDGEWTAYTAPFIVTANGAHTVTFYSVDNAGNQETEKTTTFDIQKPIDITITIKGGFGVSATIKNTGTTDVTNIGWTINLNGGLILLGKTKTGEIPSIAAGDEVTVKDLVFGFGKPAITVTAGDAEVSATGTVLLFFVIGVA